jgi:hypothetical protein
MSGQEEAMGTRAALALLIGCGLIITGAATNAAAQPYVQTCALAAPLFPGCETGRLEVEMSAQVAPRKLSTHQMAPIALELGGTVGTSGGGHPSALREVNIDFLHMAIDARELPACGLQDLQRRRVAAARLFCREAIVGSGMSHVGFTRTGARVAAPLTLFNGGVDDGVTTLFIHSAVPTPRPVPVISVMKISRFADGKDQGLRTVWHLPPIADGTGSLLDFRFRLRRYLPIAGARHGYLAAKCANGVLRADVEKLLFRNEAKTPGVAPTTVVKGGIAIPCSPMRSVAQKRQDPPKRVESGEAGNHPAGDRQSAQGYHGGSPQLDRFVGPLCGGRRTRTGTDWLAGHDDCRSPGDTCPLHPPAADASSETVLRNPQIQIDTLNFYFRLSSVQNGSESVTSASLSACLSRSLGSGSTTGHSTATTNSPEHACLPSTPLTRDANTWIRIDSCVMTPPSFQR